MDKVTWLVLQPQNVVVPGCDAQDRLVVEELNIPRIPGRYDPTLLPDARSGVVAEGGRYVGFGRCEAMTWCSCRMTLGRR